MKKYFVKTRNWHRRQSVHEMLSLSHSWGVKRGDEYTDGDGKFYIETALPLALMTWLYFKALEPWTGGMVIWVAIP